MVKLSVLQEDIKILNVYAPSKYIRQKLINLKGVVDKFTSIIEDFNTLFLVINKTSRQKMFKNIHYMNNTISRLDLTNSYRALHSTMAE